MLFDPQAANPDALWTMEKAWFEFLAAFPPGQLYWGQDPDVWKHNLRMAFAHICPEPETAHTENIGGGDWLFDVVWAIGNPQTASFISFGMAVEIAWPWAAHSWAEWTQDVVEHSNRLHAAECESKVLVVAAPLFEDDPFMRATVVTDKCREQYARVPYEVLHVICHKPQQGNRGCSIRGIWYDCNSISVKKYGDRVD